MHLDLHLVPGMFGDAHARLLARLQEGSGGEATWADGSTIPIDELVRRILEPPPGGSLKARLATRLGAGRRAEVEIEAFGAEPAGRVLLGLRVSARSGTLKDLELGLLGLACAALARESQGAVLIGSDLGRVGVGLVRGTIADQVRALLAVLDARVGIVVAAPDTADACAALPGFVVGDLGGLSEYRRP